MWISYISLGISCFLYEKFNKQIIYYFMLFFYTASIVIIIYYLFKNLKTDPNKKFYIQLMFYFVTISPYFLISSGVKLDRKALIIIFSIMNFIPLIYIYYKKISELSDVKIYFSYYVKKLTLINALIFTIVKIYFPTYFDRLRFALIPILLSLSMLQIIKLKMELFLDEKNNSKKIIGRKVRRKF